MVNKNIVLLHVNATAHRSTLFKQYLAWYNITSLEHPLYSWGMKPINFYLFLLEIDSERKIIQGCWWCDCQSNWRKFRNFCWKKLFWRKCNIKLFNGHSFCKTSQIQELFKIILVFLTVKIYFQIQC